MPYPRNQLGLTGGTGGIRIRGEVEADLDACIASEEAVTAGVRAAAAGLKGRRASCACLLRAETRVEASAKP